jgi:hypothetical protein
MSVFDRTQLPHPYLPSDWGPTVRADERANAPALPDVNPGAIVAARMAAKAQTPAAGGGGASEINGDVPKEPDIPGTYPEIGDATLPVQWLTKGSGSASLIGWAEFTSPSSPPKKYRRITRSGAALWSFFASYDCTGDVVSTSSQTYGGECHYDPVTGDLVSNNTFISVPPDSVFPDSRRSSCTIHDYTTGVFGEPFLWSRTLTPTTRVQEPISVCHYYGPQSARNSGTLTETLSDEDTDADAVARIDALGWELGDNNAVSSWEVRTDGFSFAYLPVQWAMAKSGFTPGASFQITVEYWRRAYGTGDYTLLDTVVVPATISDAGNFVANGTIPNEAGYQTKVVSDWIPVPPGGGGGGGYG